MKRLYFRCIIRSDVNMAKFASLTLNEHKELIGEVFSSPFCCRSEWLKAHSHTSLILHLLRNPTEYALLWMNANHWLEKSIKFGREKKTNWKLDCFIHNLKKKLRAALVLLHMLSMLTTCSNSAPIQFISSLLTWLIQCAMKGRRSLDDSLATGCGLRTTACHSPQERMVELHGV